MVGFAGALQLASDKFARLLVDELSIIEGGLVLLLKEFIILSRHAISFRCK